MRGLAACSHIPSLTLHSFFLHVVIEPSAPEVFLGLAGRYAAEQDERHEVGDGHEGIHRVGNIPDNMEVDDASEEEGDEIRIFFISCSDICLYSFSYHFGYLLTMTE